MPLFNSPLYNRFFSDSAFRSHNLPPVWKRLFYPALASHTEPVPGTCTVPGSFASAIMKRKMGFGFSPLKLISKSHPKEQKPPVDDWDDNFDSPFDPTFVNRPPPLDPIIEHELRKSCAIILQGLKPSGYDIDDTRMRSDELVEQAERERADHLTHRSHQRSVPIKAPQKPSIRPDRSHQSTAQTEKPKKAHSAAAWIMDAQSDEDSRPPSWVTATTAAVLQKPDPPAKSVHRPTSSDTQPKQPPEKSSKRFSAQGPPDAFEFAALSQSQRLAAEAPLAPAPTKARESRRMSSQDVKQNDGSTQSTRRQNARRDSRDDATKRITESDDDTSSNYSRDSDELPSTSTNLTSAPVTPSASSKRLPDNSSTSQAASTYIRPEDGLRMKQEVEKHRQQGNKSLAPPGLARDPNPSPGVRDLVSFLQVNDAPQSQTKSSSAPRSMASSIKDNVIAGSSRASRPDSRTSKREVDAPASRPVHTRSDTASSRASEPDSATVVARRSSGEADRGPPPNPERHVPPVPFIDADAALSSAKSPVLNAFPDSIKNNDRALDEEALRMKEKKLIGIKDKSDEPLQTSRSRMAAHDSKPNPNNDGGRAHGNTPTIDTDKANKSNPAIPPTSILKSPTQRTFTGGSNVSKHQHDDSIIVKDFYKPADTVRSPMVALPRRYEAVKRSDPVAADFDALMSVVRDSSDPDNSAAKRQYPVEIIDPSPSTLSAPPARKSGAADRSDAVRDGNTKSPVSSLSPSASTFSSSSYPTRNPPGPHGTEDKAPSLRGKISSRSQSMTTSSVLDAASAEGQYDDSTQPAFVDIPMSPNRGPSRLNGSDGYHSQSQSQSQSNPHFRVISPPMSNFSGAGNSMAPSLRSGTESKKSRSGMRRLLSKLAGNSGRHVYVPPPTPAGRTHWDEVDDGEEGWDEEACAAPVVGFGRGW